MYGVDGKPLHYFSHERCDGNLKWNKSYIWYSFYFILNGLHGPWIATDGRIAFVLVRRPPTTITSHDWYWTGMDLQESELSSAKIWIVVVIDDISWVHTFKKKPIIWPCLTWYLKKLQSNIEKEMLNSIILCTSL